MKRFTLVMLASLALACPKDDHDDTGSESDTDTDSDTDSDTDADADADSDADADTGPLQEGTWMLAHLGTADGVCKHLVPDTDLDVQIENDGAGGFVLTDYVYQHLCTVTDETFACDRVNTGTNDLKDQGLAAVLYRWEQFSGAILDPSAIEGVIAFSLICEGDDCDVVEARSDDVPCSVEEDVTATAIVP